jgi:hypothetical protein
VKPLTAATLQDPELQGAHFRSYMELIDAGDRMQRRHRARKPTGAWSDAPSSRHLFGRTAAFQRNSSLHPKAIQTIATNLSDMRGQLVWAQGRDDPTVT